MRLYAKWRVGIHDESCYTDITGYLRSIWNMNAHVIRVVLADDHSVVRRGIRDFLTDAGDIVVVAEAETGRAALALIAQYQPDVAILDIRMPDGTGIETAQELRRLKQTLGILILDRKSVV